MINNEKMKDKADHNLPHVETNPTAFLSARVHSPDLRNSGVRTFQSRHPSTRKPRVISIGTIYIYQDIFTFSIFDYLLFYP